MQRYFVLLGFILALGLSAPVWADTKPVVTPAVNIAVLHLQLTDPKADYESWLQKTPLYTIWTEENRPAMLKQKVTEMETVAKSLTKTAPVVIEIPARIEADNFVLDFENVASLSYEYMGLYYALNPVNAPDYKTLKFTTESKPAILKETDNGANIKLVITMLPESAVAHPLLSGDKNYHPVNAKISDVALWTNDGKTVVWNIHQ